MEGEKNKKQKWIRIEITTSKWWSKFHFFYRTKYIKCLFRSSFACICTHLIWENRFNQNDCFSSMTWELMWVCLCVWIYAVFYVVLLPNVLELRDSQNPSNVELLKETLSDCPCVWCWQHEIFEGRSMYAY